MKSFAFFLVLIALTIQTNGARDFIDGEFTESLLSTQDDLSSAHMYFQVQLSIMTRTFDSYMATLNEKVLPYLATGVEDFDDMRRETETAIVGKSPTCMSEWDRIQMQYGRELSNCASYPQYEIEWMLLLHNLYSWFAEIYSNNVQLYGLQAFTRYNPLTNSEQDINAEINQQLRQSLIRFLTDDYAGLSFLENYVFDYFEEISYNSYFCMYSLIGRFSTATNNIVTQCQIEDENFTASLLSTQDDLASAHMYFQVQLSIMTRTFDSYMATLNEKVLPYLTAGVEDFEDMRRETETALVGKHPTCMSQWDRIQMQYGRELSNCASYPQFEIEWMLLLHNLYSWFAEIYSNNVQLYGLQAFTRYNPLTNSVQDINAEINQQLRQSLIRFLTDDYAGLSFLESYVFDYFEEISYNSYFCMFSLIGRFSTATNNIVSDAATGPCL